MGMADCRIRFAKDDTLAEKRNTTIARSNITDAVRERVWGRAAARCVLCSEWLIDSSNFWHSVPTGEIAHNVGATSGSKSPRGDSKLTDEERAEETNLFLLCHDCHKKIDSTQHRDKYSVEFLASKKREHEARVRQVTDFATLRPTTVLRLVGSVRGTLSPVSPEQISEALRREGLTGLGEATRNGIFEIILPDDESAPWTWARAKDSIDKTVARVFEAVAAEDTSVLSVFAFASIPVLTYLGSRLDDKTETVLFPRHRSDEVGSWAWSEERGATPVPTFVVENMIGPETGKSAETVQEVVVLVSLSAKVSRARIPAALSTLPLLELRADRLQASPDLIDGRAALDAFGQAWRDALSLVEATYPKARRIHLIAAVPTTAAVTLGRHHMREAQPGLVLYQRRKDDSYEAVLEITA
jgi:hypothetical protein